LECTGQKCPVVFNAIPKVNGLNIKVDGSDEKKNIAKIHVDWGDGKTNDTTNFPLIHKYSKPGPYIVTIAATSNLGVTVSQSIPLERYFIENSIPADSNSRYSAEANASLNVNTSSPSIQDNSPIPFIISGQLSSLNASSVNKVPISINMYLVANPALYDNTYSKKTEADGTYSFEYQGPFKNDGLYKIAVRPTDQRFPGFNVKPPCAGLSVRDICKYEYRWLLGCLSPCQYIPLS
jgi:PKD repeat protein